MQNTWQKMYFADKHENMPDIQRLREKAEKSQGPGQKPQAEGLDLYPVTDEKLQPFALSRSPLTPIHSISPRILT